MFTYDIRVFEKAENWYFYETVQADSQEQALAIVRKMYAKQRGFVVISY